MNTFMCPGKAIFSLCCLAMISCGGGSGGVGDTSASTAGGDSAAPVITLNGSEEVQHQQGTAYVDAGAQAMDETDGVVAVQISGSVAEDAGTYTITYRATDSAGNSASKTRTVIVADTLAPDIVLLGDSSMTLAADESYVEPGAVATDSLDGDLAVSISGSVGTAAGTYVLTYSATDQAGNQQEIYRTVQVGVSAEDSDLVVFKAGAVGGLWDGGIRAFDQALGFTDCINDGGAGCPSLDWEFVDVDGRDSVLQITHSSSGQLAGLFFASSGVIDASGYAGGDLMFDIRVVSGDANITMKLDCEFPCTSGDQNLGTRGTSGWETVNVAFSTLVSGGLDLSRISTGLVIWASNATDTVFQIDNVRYTGIADGSLPPTAPIDPDNPTNYEILSFGAGSIADTINPDSYRCVVDFGNWIYNAGVVEPAIDSCNPATQIPTGTPRAILPKLAGKSAEDLTQTHRWWGSVAFLGAMEIGNPDHAAYITPDPITARISTRGARIAGMPSGLAVAGNDFLYSIPDPFAEVFDGIAIGNSQHSVLQAYLRDHSDGAMTVLWRNGSTDVMEATFVHGSPYVYFRTFEGDLMIRTLRADGGEKGIFYQQDNSLGVWTNVAGNLNHFLVTGEGATSFSNVSSNEIRVQNTAGELTLSYLPGNSTPSVGMTQFFANLARNVVRSVEIDYSVAASNQQVTVSHRFLDENGLAIETLAGLFPMHWKYGGTLTSGYEVRSNRGLIKFASTEYFDYELPYVGVLPTLPLVNPGFDQDALEALVDEFIATGEDNWNPYKDTYWSGKTYGKVAELLAITDLTGMTSERNQLLAWLKSELQDWFSAERNSVLDSEKYFVYDSDWNTLLGMEESFAAHQQLNDHHFHYGYFVRAAAEICRQDLSWCGDDQYGPMIELLIRDYAAGRDDELFPYLRHFDPANGFSWASGRLNFVRGNNNESTSEAANAYGAMVLFGMLTDRPELVERGIYLHASTTASYWQYWNNIDGYNNRGADEDNFPAGYSRITTSIVWGNGAVFSTWFSAAFAHILGIQGLPTSTTNLGVGLNATYMEDYIELGLSESSNNLPSGLPDGQWRDIWWNLWAMIDAPAALADYNTVSNYIPEEGETRAHTYYWLHNFQTLGQVATGSSALTADHPMAVAFKTATETHYVVYNTATTEQRVTFSDGIQIDATPGGFTVDVR